MHMHKTSCTRGKKRVCEIGRKREGEREEGREKEREKKEKRLVKMKSMKNKFEQKTYSMCCI